MAGVAPGVCFTAPPRGLCEGDENVAGELKTGIACLKHCMWVGTTHGAAEVSWVGSHRDQ